MDPDDIIEYLEFQSLIGNVQPEPWDRNLKTETEKFQSLIGNVQRQHERQLNGY